MLSNTKSEAVPHIVLWNARGLNCKLNDLKNYVSTKQPQFICITETNLKAHQDPKLPNYILTRKDREDGYGGVAIFHHRATAVRQHQLSSHNGGKIGALSLEYNFQGQWSTLIVLYNPCKNIDEEEIAFYFDKIQNVGLLYGDLNAHHPSWQEASTSANYTGSSLFNNLNQSTHLNLLNPKNFKTRTDPHSEKTSNLDLFITTSHYTDKQLTVGASMGSDHSVIIMEDQDASKPRLYNRPRWAVKKQRWSEWAEALKIKCSIPSHSSSDDYSCLINDIISTSHEFLCLQDSSVPRQPGQPWWNADCEEAVSRRKKTLKNFQKYQTAHNKMLFNKTSKEAKEIIIEAKKTAWKSFLSELSTQTSTTRVWKFFKAMKGTAPSSAILF